MSKTREQLEEEARLFDLSAAVPPVAAPVVTVTVDVSAAEREFEALRRRYNWLVWQRIGAEWAETMHRQRWRVLMATTPYYRA